jgi:uncharacterized membrane-anchored protein
LGQGWRDKDTFRLERGVGRMAIESDFGSHLGYLPDHRLFKEAEGRPTSNFTHSAGDESRRRLDKLLKSKNGLSKVPEATIGFWLVKVAATTLGETGGDALSMSMHLGYALSSAIFLIFFVVMVAVQLATRTFHPFLYWSVIVATTTAGTTMADFADRSLNIGYVGGSLVLLASLLAILGCWRFAVGSVSVDHIISRKAEAFYWITILFSNTLGTALGDFFADDSGLGYGGAAIVFSAALALVAMAYFRTNISRTLLFWLAFILTRPLGATLGDLLTKPFEHGGFNLGRISSSLIIAIFIAGFVLISAQRERTPSKRTVA